MRRTIRSRKSKNQKTSSKKLYIAVVIKNKFPFVPLIVSQRELGDWACFVGSNKKTIIERALGACRKWARSSGDYVVLCGALTEGVQIPEHYEIVKLNI